MNKLTYITQVIKRPCAVDDRARSAFAPADNAVGTSPAKSTTLHRARTMMNRDKRVGTIPGVQSRQLQREASRAARLRTSPPATDSGLHRAAVCHAGSSTGSGMVLRVQVIDHTRYKLTIKEALTIKPEGFKIRLRRVPTRPWRSRRHRSWYDTAERAAPDTDQGVKGDGRVLTVIYAHELGTAATSRGQIADAKGRRVSGTPALRHARWVA